MQNNRINRVERQCNNQYTYDVADAEPEPGGRADNNVRQIDTGPRVPDDHFVAYGAVTVFCSHKKTDKCGDEDSNCECIDKENICDLCFIISILACGNVIHYGHKYPK